MMCDKCGKNLATTHIKTVINGEVREHNLCSFCAAKQGYSSFGGLSLSNMLSSMLEDSTQISSAHRVRCRCCGSSFSDIAESGRAGCSECYETFKKELLPSLSRLHGKVKHIGRAPEGFTMYEEKEQKIENLKKELKAAVEREEFETAAKLRDEIKAMEGEKN